MVQDAVLARTTTKRARLAIEMRQQHPGWSGKRIQAEVDEEQPLIEEYDPVVELALIASDYSIKTELRRQANADAAQYLRPRLKTVEHLEDPLAAATAERKVAAAERIALALRAIYGSKSDAKPATDGRATGAPPL